MKITLGAVRREIREAKVAASKDYMKKEWYREKLQELLIGAVASGRLPDQQSLDVAFDALAMALNALKMIPFPVWQKLSNK